MKFNLKTLREINKLTQKELAEKIGVSRKTIIRYENKQTIPNIIEASKLALALEVSLDDLIGGMLQN
ncbi:MAG: helix-turn-helix transcriptional regulator [Sarcina sp.]